MNLNLNLSHSDRTDAMPTQTKQEIQPAAGEGKGTHGWHSSRIAIKDDGKGFIPGGNSGVKKNRRLGLLGMKERVEMAEGTLRFISAPGQSTTVIAEFSARGPTAKKRLRKPSPETPVTPPA